MKNKIKLSYTDFKKTCDDAYSANISNPTVFWNPEDGFYVSPAANLVPNSDLEIGLAYYSLNNNCARSLPGRRQQYNPIARAIREFYSGDFDPIIEDANYPVYCTGIKSNVGENENNSCYEYFFPGKCPACGHVNVVKKIKRKITLSELVDNAINDAYEG